MFQSFACLFCLSIGTPRDKSMAKQILAALDENEAIELLLKVVDKQTRAHMNTSIHPSIQTYIHISHAHTLPMPLAIDTCTYPREQNILVHMSMNWDWKLISVFFVDVARF